MEFSVAEISFTGAVVAGLLSFLSPCVLPLVPAYLSFMSGVSLEEMRVGATEGGDKLKLRALFHSLAFVLGFSVVFILLGASATALGEMMRNYMPLLSKVGGVLIILFGFHYMGLFRIPMFNLEARYHLDDKPPGLWGAFAIGLSFALGWTPCVGPILAAILGMAGGQESVQQGIALLAFYSMGLGVPFLIAGLAINVFFGFFTRIRRHLRKIEMVSGVLLVLVGILFLTNDFFIISTYLIQWFPGLMSLG